MLCVWVHGYDPGRVLDGSRLALCQTLSIECPSSIFFLACALCYCSFLFVIFLFLFCFCFVCTLPLELCRCLSDLFPVLQTTYRIGNNVYLLGIVEARPVIVKNTTTTTTGDWGMLRRSRCVQIFI